MIQYLLNGDPLLPFLIKALFDQVNGVLSALLELGDIKADLLGAGKRSNLIFISRIKGKVLGEHDIEHNSEGPNVYSDVVRLAEDDFRRAVAKSSENIVRLLLGPQDLGESKVDTLSFSCARVIRHHDILQLDVSVDNSNRVEVINGLADLVKDLPNSSLTDLELPFLEVIEKIPTCEVLHNNIDLISILKSLQHLTDKRMLTHLENIDLIPLLLQLKGIDALLLDQLNGNFPISLLLQSNINYPKLAS